MKNLVEENIKMRIFTIYDCKGGMFNVPFFQRTKAMAIRLFSDLVNDPKHPIGEHPEDYTLFCLGCYDDCSGTITLMDIKENLGVGIEYVKQQKPNVLSIEGVVK